MIMILSQIALLLRLMYNICMYNMGCTLDVDDVDIHNIHTMLSCRNSTEFPFISLLNYACAHQLYTQIPFFFSRKTVSFSFSTLYDQYLYTIRKPFQYKTQYTLHYTIHYESFPWKLYMMLDAVEQTNQQHIVSWMSHGKAFKVHNPQLFAHYIMPECFSNSSSQGAAESTTMTASTNNPKRSGAKYTSFQRQLNMYGFARFCHQGGRDKGAYYHKCFVRGHRYLCRGIIRHKIKGNRVRTVLPLCTKEPDFYTNNNDNSDNNAANMDPDQDTNATQQQLQQPTQQQQLQQQQQQENKWSVCGGFIHNNTPPDKDTLRPVIESGTEPDLSHNHNENNRHDTVNDTVNDVNEDKQQQQYCDQNHTRDSTNRKDQQQQQQAVSSDSIVERNDTQGVYDTTTTATNTTHTRNEKHQVGFFFFFFLFS